MSNDNLRAIIFMVVSMAAFALEDLFIKKASGSLPIGEIVMILSIGGAIVFGSRCYLRGAPLLSADFLHPLVVARNVAEVLATVCYVSSLALIPLSLLAAILQATPLVVTVGAALWLKEDVGWRRWLAVLVGLVGVMIILRPGFAGFRPEALLALLATFGLAARDLASRRIPSKIRSEQLAWWAYLCMLPAAALLSVATGRYVAASLEAWAFLGLAIAIGAVAYASLIAATRIGDVSAVIPFRYSRLIFALALGVLLLGERPDTPTLLGAGIVVGSGLYAWVRERQRAALRA
ncbi:MAG: DMT family transporter [Pseudomonadota bacterium]